MYQIICFLRAISVRPLGCVDYAAHIEICYADFCFLQGYQKERWVVVILVKFRLYDIVYVGLPLVGWLFWRRHPSVEPERFWKIMALATSLHAFSLRWSCLLLRNSQNEYEPYQIVHNTCYLRKFDFEKRRAFCSSL